MGFAQGTILKEQMAKFMAGTNEYLISQATDSLPGLLPPALVDTLLVKGMDAVLSEYTTFVDPSRPSPSSTRCRAWRTARASRTRRSTA